LPSGIVIVTLVVAQPTVASLKASVSVGAKFAAPRPLHLSPQELGDRGPTAETLPRIAADQARSIAGRDVPLDERRVAAGCGVGPSADEILKFG
jgi:hypothetical protein